MASAHAYYRCQVIQQLSPTSSTICRNVHLEPRSQIPFVEASSTLPCVGGDFKKKLVLSLALLGKDSSTNNGHLCFLCCSAQKNNTVSRRFAFGRRAAGVADGQSSTRMNDTDAIFSTGSCKEEDVAYRCKIQSSSSPWGKGGGDTSTSTDSPPSPTGSFRRQRFCTMHLGQDLRHNGPDVGHKNWQSVRHQRTIEADDLVSMRAGFRRRSVLLVPRASSADMVMGTRMGDDDGDEENTVVHGHNASSSAADTPSSRLEPSVIPKTMEMDGGGEVDKIGGGRKGGVSTSTIMFALGAVGLIAAIATPMVLRGNTDAFLATISKSGFAAAFSLIFVSEIGDKTFFIAALLAMRHSRLPVMLGACSALTLMTIISVAIGRVFQKVPASLHTTLPIGEYLAVGLLVWFGLRSMKQAWDIPTAGATSAIGTTSQASVTGGGGEKGGEFEEAEELLNRTEAEKKFDTPFAVFLEAVCLIFVAEWGDRSMLATIALGAAQSPIGVAAGAILAHVMATAVAVIGGALMADRISEKAVGYTGGVLFLGFAVATLFGFF